MCEGPFGVALNRGRARGIGPATKLSEARASAGVLHLPPGAVSLTQAARRSARTSSAWSADAIERSRTGRRRRREGETRVMEEGEEEACGQSPKNLFTITFLVELWLSLSSYSPSVGYYHCLSPRPLAHCSTFLTHLLQIHLYLTLLYSDRSSIILRGVAFLVLTVLFGDFKKKRKTVSVSCSPVLCCLGAPRERRKGNNSIVFHAFICVSAFLVRTSWTRLNL